MLGAFFATSASLALLLAPVSALATLITSSSDTALNGAFVETFDSYTANFFVSQDFLSGSDGFNVRAIANDLHIDNFAFVPVPEASAAMLAGLGLVGLASVGRREARAN